VCAVGADDPFCLVWAACVFGCFTVGVTDRVPILLSYGMIVNLNVVGFVWYSFSYVSAFLSKYVLVAYDDEPINL
jgi:hypothetical protein